MPNRSRSRQTSGFALWTSASGGLPQPRRGGIRQPRATPWGRVAHERGSPERAAYEPSGGRFRLSASGRPISPFQGFGAHCDPLPRALPWAVVLRPFGAGAACSRRYSLPRGASLDEARRSRRSMHLRTIRWRSRACRKGPTHSEPPDPLTRPSHRRAKKKAATSRRTPRRLRPSRFAQLLSPWRGSFGQHAASAGWNACSR